MKSQYLLIMAGGSGTRMKSTVPKQFLTLNGIPVIIHTIRNFLAYNPNLSITVVLPSSEIEIFQTLKVQYLSSIQINVAEGGQTRFQSVKNGLATLSGEGLVAIHDAVRPFVNKSFLTRCFTSAETYSNAIACVELKESIREIRTNGNYSVDRSMYRIIQTPQCFDLSVIKKAFETEEKTSFTDDASVAENAGISINLVEGIYENIKITTPEDLVIAESILKYFDPHS